MNDILLAGLAGIAAGVVASLAMNLYQGATAGLFGVGGGNADPATVKAADTAKLAVGAPPVTQKRRAEAGGLVHYGTGAVLGVVYALLVMVWPMAALGFGTAFGVVVALVLDDLVVPAFGWGPWPWATPVASHVYSLTSHVVFGLVLEAARRLVVTAIA